MSDFINEDQVPYDEPAYVISVAAKLVSLHPQTLRYYERLGLVKPTRTEGRIRLYSRRNLEMVRRIARLTEELGVNLAGVEVILNMSRKLALLQDELEREREGAQKKIEQLQEQIRRLEAELQPDRDRPVINVSARELTPDTEEEYDHDDGPTTTVIT